MMLTKPKPDKKKGTGSSSSEDDLEKELERRLSNLGAGFNNVNGAHANEMNEDVAVVNDAEYLTKPSDGILPSFDDRVEKKEALAATSTSVAEITKKVAPMSQKKTNKSALLARIMAAQEKAKLDQIKQTSASSTSSITQKSTTSLHPPPPPPAFSETMINAEEERQKMMRALNGQTVADDESKQKSKSMLYDSSLSSLKPPPLPPTASHSMPPLPVFSSSEALHLPPPSMPPPSYSSQTLPPPPSFEKTFQRQKPAATTFAPPRMPPPPAFDAIENDLYNIPHVQAPTAPPTRGTLMDNYHGITPMRPPSLPNYSTSRAVQEMDDELFLEFDFDGNKMSAEERHKMMEEQRAIMEQIERQSGENKASETAISSNTLEGGFRAALIQNSHVNNASSCTNNNTTSDMDFSTVDPEQLEEQRAIMEDIERRKNVSSQQKAPDVSLRSAAAPSRNSVQIGGGQNVALHGQEKTKAAIQDGTAILVQCMNCDNWMQITSSAALMYCPICKTVSSVVKQDGVTYAAFQKETQMEEDRKLAERLQQEMEGDIDEPRSVRIGYPGGRRSNAASAVSSEVSSWWSSIKSSVGMGNTKNEGGSSTEVDNDDRLGPPRLHGVTTGEDSQIQEETPSSYDSTKIRNTESESKPQRLLSSFYDSVTNAASAAATGASSMLYGDENEIHGVDTTSFLAIPNVNDEERS